MTLATHAIIGAASASLTPNYPVLGFALGFGSHYLLDAIPHWDYSIASMKVDKNNIMNNDMIIGKNFYSDLLKICIDGLLGLLISLLVLVGFYQHSTFLVLLGATAGMLPDALQFVYFKWRHEPLISLQKFHTTIHSKISLHNKPVLGISFQVLFIILILVSLK